MDKIKNVAHRLGIITVEDMERYTALELIMMIANKVNDHSDKIQYLFNEGLLSEVEQIFNEWMEDGTFDTLINQSALEKVNDRIDETNARWSNKTKNWICVNEFKCDDGQYVQGDGIHDDTSGIQKALDYARDNNIEKIVFDAKTYMIKCDSKVDNVPHWLDRYRGLRVYSNTTIDLNGATLKVIPTSSKNYILFDILESNNIKIKNGTLYGDRDDHNGVQGEWGYGISIQNSSNIEIDNIVSRNMWGDGIYFANLFTDSDVIDNVKVTNSVMDNNRRQGVSISGGSNILFENCVFKNTKGTAPQAGIDIEPDAGFPEVTNLEIRNCKFINNAGHGITCVKMGEDVDLACKNLFIENCNFYGDTVSLYYAQDVKINNCTDLNILFQDASHLTISNNTTNNRQFCSLHNVDRAFIFGNTMTTPYHVTENFWGYAMVMSGYNKNIIFTDNYIYNLKECIILADNTTFENIKICRNIFNKVSRPINKFYDTKQRIVKATNFEISDNTFEAENGSKDYCVYLENTDGLIIKNNNIINYNSSICCSTVTDAVIDSNYFRNKTTSTYAIVMAGRGECKIQKNIFDWNAESKALYFEHGESPLYVRFHFNDISYKNVGDSVTDVEQVYDKATGDVYVFNQSNH